MEAVYGNRFDTASAFLSWKELSLRIQSSTWIPSTMDLRAEFLIVEQDVILLKESWSLVFLSYTWSFRDILLDSRGVIRSK